MKKKDLFISHASEDKDDFVRPLTNLLTEYGLDVWYDEFELKIGTSLSRSIDKGISNSNFGLIVLSKSFFSKNWTEYELRSLNSYEIESGDILLPIWKGVTVKEVRNFSPYLADKFALTTKDTIEDISLKIIENCNPKLFSEIHYKIRLDGILKTAKVEKRLASELKAAPIRHLKLNENLISRIRLIRSSLLLCYPHSMAFWLDGFQRDMNVENEIRYWEHISTCFLEIIVEPEMFKLYKGVREKFYEDVFQLIFQIDNLRFSKDEDFKFSENFDSEFIKKATNIFSNNIPTYDFEEELPFEKNT